MSKPEINENLMRINKIVSCLSIQAQNNEVSVIDFLNNLLITDLHSIQENNLQFSALCNPKGRIIATFWIDIINASEVYIFCAQNMQEILLQFFNARKFRLKINIATNPIQLCINPQSKKLLILKDTYTPIKSAGTNDFYIFIINKQLPWIDASNTEKFIPQHVNLDLHENIMSFKKGCYPGQEIIARIKFLGKIKKRMITVKNSDKNTLMNETNELEKVSPIIYDKSNNTFIIQVIK
jgi:hypothetical protein